MIMTMNDRFYRRQPLPYLGRTTLDRLWIHTQVGDNDIVWPGKIQKPLLPLYAALYARSPERTQLIKKFRRNSVTQFF